MARCATAGLFAALGPVLGRMASAGVEVDPFAFAPWAWPLMCSAGVVVCNVAMWALYISGMDAISSLQATVLNSGSNIACSGILGHLLLDEVVTSRWMAGVACICGGLLLLTVGTQEGSEKAVAHRDKAKVQ